MIDKGRCDRGFIWNPSIWECEYDKSCDVWEYVDYANCKCWKRLIGKLVEECSEDANGNEMIHNVTLNDHRKVCNSCTIYIVLLVIALLIIIGINSAFIYFHWHLKRDSTNSITNAYINTETVIYHTYKWEVSNK